MLSRSEILRQVGSGRIGVTPFEAANVGPVSVDLRLGSTFRVFKRVQRSVRVSEGLDVDEFTTKVDLLPGEVLEVSPGELVLGCTLERIRLPPGFAGTLTGRSRFARLGLAVHVSSSLVQPGVDNVQVLEILNNSPYPIELEPGVRVCQLMLHRVEGRAGSVYEGKYKFQSAP